MEATRQRILIIAGEESGDMRASALVNSIKSINKDVSFSGIGGERCRAAGVELIADITQLAVIGFTDVIKHFRRIKGVFDLTVEHAKKTKPDAAILVDYPGFNLRLARELKKLNIKIIYYISPQVWAWKASRVKLIKQIVDRMLVLFPFEKEFYARRGYTVDFVGHPLIDEARANKGCSQFLKELGLSDQKKVLGLLPGSREKEISRHLPVMISAASLITKTNPDCQVLLLRAKNIKKELFDQYLKTAGCRITVTDDYYNGLNASDVCVVSSGTATLETGILGKPMVVIYKTSWITWLLAKLVIKIPYIALVNIVAGKEIAKELIQNNASPKRIANEIRLLLNNSQEVQAIRNDLKVLSSRLGTPGASLRAAKVVLEELSRKS